MPPAKGNYALSEAPRGKESVMRRIKAMFKRLDGKKVESNIFLCKPSLVADLVGETAKPNQELQKWQQSGSVKIFLIYLSEKPSSANR